MVVDVSNVGRDTRVAPFDAKGKGSFERVERVVRAWRATHGPVDVRYVADRSFRKAADAATAKRWRGLVEQLGIEELPEADGRILELAERLGWCVLSRDLWRDKRAEHPWVNRSAERFWTWEAGADGTTVVFLPAGIVPMTDREVSKFGEIKELQAAGLDPRADRPVLTAAWACRNPPCIVATMYPERTPFLPVRGRNDAPSCSSCRQPLVQVGDRGRVLHLVVSDPSGRELVRVPIGTGQPLVVGRGSSADISVDAIRGLEARAGRISRRHVALELDEAAQLWATELGSRNGTREDRFDRTTGTWTRARALTAGRRIGWNGLTSRLVLADTLVIERSGHRFDPNMTGRAESPHAEPDATQLGTVGDIGRLGDQGS